MQQQSANLPVYLALILAILVAFASNPSRGMSVDAKLLWLLATAAAADQSPNTTNELQQLGLP